MKKILVFLLMLILGCNMPVNASEIEVLATMQSRTNAQDRVWVGTFQLVWNDFIDKITHNPVRFREGTPVIVHELNKQEFTVKDLSEKNFYKMAGKVTKNTKKQIAKAIKKKFNETSDILDKLDLQPKKNQYIIYAMLKKDFEFLHEFDNLETASFGKSQTSEYFGINLKSDKQLRSGVKVLFYNSPADYAVSLETKDNDIVYLYKNSSNKPFNNIYDDMIKKNRNFKGDKSFLKNDELKVPNIKFFTEKSFDEICGKRIMGTNLFISQALETIRFDMNRKGVELKSEAAMTVMKMSLTDEDEKKPRLFYFDDTFVIFLIEKDKHKPYFALRVHDISKFQD